jgi:hypothetical protein
MSHSLEDSIEKTWLMTVRSFTGSEVQEYWPGERGPTLPDVMDYFTHMRDKIHTVSITQTVVHKTTMNYDANSVEIFRDMKP